MVYFTLLENVLKIMNTELIIILAEGSILVNLIIFLCSTVTVVYVYGFALSYHIHIVQRFKSICHNYDLCKIYIVHVLEILSKINLL
jgi:hypothetical protein